MHAHVCGMELLEETDNHIRFYNTDYKAIIYYLAYIDITYNVLIILCTKVSQPYVACKEFL